MFTKKKKRVWLIINLCNNCPLLCTNLPETQWLNTMINYLLCFTGNENQEFRSSMAEWFQLEVPHEIAGRCQMGQLSFESLTGAEGSPSRWSWLSSLSWMLAGDLSSSPCGPLVMSSLHGHWLSRMHNLRNQAELAMPLWPSLGS